MDWYSDDSDSGYGYDDDIAVVDGVASSNVVHDSGSTSHNSDKNYTILNEDEIGRRQNEDINHTSSVLSLSTAEASLLLCQYNWSVEKLHEDWFADEFAVRKKVGLLINGDEIGRDDSGSAKKECGVCFDDFDDVEMRSLSCGHRFCVTCWKGYISTNIAESGSGALSLKCQGFKCGAAVTRDLINEFASEEEKEKYDRYLVRSYVESSKEKTKWCPAAGCDHAVEFERDGRGFGYDVTCACSYSFCWNCAEEPHRPVDCKLVEKWILKNSSEAENTKWILAYSKPCPKCKRPIEKNRGCNHMTCGPPCKFEFCWLCLGSYHHSHRCNGYVKQKVDKDELIMKERARMSLLRYAHYYERWASNHKSREKAIEDLHRMETDELTKLSDIVRTPTAQLNFIVEGWKQIIECRRVLKWTYAYGYYLMEHEPAKKQFFEYLQGQAENYLERLHACAERELSPFLKDGAAAQHMSDQVDKMELDFNAYRTKLVGLTKVTSTHFEELVRALENGLSDVVVQALASTAAPSHSKAKKGQKRKFSNSSSRQPIVAVDFDMDYGDFWCCDRCTYRNPVDATACAMCYDGE